VYFAADYGGVHASDDFVHMFEVDRAIDYVVVESWNNALFSSIILNKKRTALFKLKI
jgi:hypothetical protein